MAVLSLLQLQLAFGHVPLLDHTDFSLDKNERVGLIGRNGTGKSSLLKIIAGSQLPDDGLINRQEGLTTIYVEQEPQFDASTSVYDAIAQGLPAAYDALHTYQMCLHSLTDDPATHEALHIAQERLEHTDAWSMHVKIQSLLDQLELSAEQTMGTLSGGTRKKVALARALFPQPDVLLLDEPTNHLDIPTIQWLEERLRSFNGAVVCISHDREFLDQVVTRIVELDRGILRSYAGNFAEYLRRKEEQLHAEQLENARFDKLLAQEEVWIRKGVEARRTRSVGRVKRLLEMRAERSDRREQVTKAQLSITQANQSGKKVAELVDVHKSYADRTIIRGYSTVIQRGDKVGLIGANGVGKTTLLRVLLGLEKPDAGHVDLGSNIEIAYFDQMRSQLDPNATLIEVISPGSEWVEIQGQRKHVMSYLNDFLFSPQRARSPVHSLSGGERARLLLARLFARPANVLVLDEPTNDLDIETLELLEERLQEFTGTVFLVSHDRSFLDHVVTQTIAFAGEGSWVDTVGGYTDWVEQRGGFLAAVKARPSAAPAVVEPTPAPVKTEASSGRTPKIKTRLSMKDERELADLMQKIAALEAEQGSIEQQLADGTLFTNNWEQAQAYTQQLESITATLEQYYDRWQTIENSVQSS